LKKENKKLPQRHAESTNFYMYQDRVFCCSNAIFGSAQTLHAIYVKKTYQFTTVCKDDVMTSVLWNSKNYLGNLRWQRGSVGENAIGSIRWPIPKSPPI